LREKETDVVYPFAKAPTYAELKDRLQREFGCKLLSASSKLTDPNGKEHTVYYFERTFEGKTLRVVAPDLRDEDRVLYSVTRSLCNRLKVPLEAFGLPLG
jgi:hypothetical protein